MSAEGIGRSLGAMWAKSRPISKLLFIVGIGALVAMCTRPIDAPPQREQTAAPQPDPDVEAARTAAKQKEELAFQKTTLFAASLKKSLRDPESLVLESVRANDDATIICIEYRARNGFGGMNRELAIYANRKVSQEPKFWNTYCTKPLNNMKHVKYALR